MAQYIDGNVIKKSVELLTKTKKTKVNGSSFFAYLILRRHMVLMGTSAELPIKGSVLKDAALEASLVNRDSKEAAGYNPLEDEYRTWKWCTSNGPSDAIKNWSGRTTVVERLNDHTDLTINVAPFDANAIKDLLKLQDAGRPDIVDMAVWWYRDKNVEPFMNLGSLTVHALRTAFTVDLGLKTNEVELLFGNESSYDDDTELATSNDKAAPSSYLRPVEVRAVAARRYQMKSYEAGSCQQLIDAVRQSGYIFTREQIATYLTAVRTKPFIILAGVSGTGKTHLPITLAKSTGSDYIVCSVRPDWTDSSPLLGYTDITGKFHPGMLLEYAKKAMEEPDREYFFLLDEMNLAHVEYYLSDVLSKMETMKINTTTERLESEPLMPGIEDWSNVVIPSNLCFVGSINMDESTQPISKKVLDRAFVLDFNEVDLTIAQEPVSGEMETLQWDSKEWGSDRLPMFGTVGLEPDEFTAVAEKLTDVNKIMRAGGFNFGYRLRNEICAFIANSKNIDTAFSDDDTNSSAFDIALKSKALSRIEGQGIVVSDIIRGLRAYLKDDDGDTMADSKTRFQRTLNKLSDMADMFDRTGYASYWI